MQLLNWKNETFWTFWVNFEQCDTLLSSIKDQEKEGKAEQARKVGPLVFQYTLCSKLIAIQQREESSRTSSKGRTINLIDCESFKNEAPLPQNFKFLDPSSSLLLPQNSDFQFLVKTTLVFRLPQWCKIVSTDGFR